jgi:AraC-like DNA-binding protein
MQIVLAEGSIIGECSNSEFSLHHCCNINEHDAKNFYIKEYADYSLFNNFPYIVTHNIDGIDFQLLYIPVQQQNLMIIFYSRYNFFTETIAREVLDFLLSIRKIVAENVEKTKQKINKSTGETISYKLENKIQLAKDYIEKNYQYNISKHDIATVVDLNADYFARLFKQLTGENIGDYINRIRIANASELLIATDKKIIEKPFDVGFEDLSTFNRNFFKFLKNPLKHLENNNKIYAKIDIYSYALTHNHISDLLIKNTNQKVFYIFLFTGGLNNEKLKISTIGCCCLCCTFHFY